MFDGFDWDGGNESKIKQRVPIQVVENLFEQKVLLKEDLRHSLRERRWVAMGEVKGGKILFVAFTLRAKGSKTLIRIISARYTHKREQEEYEKVKESLTRSFRG